MAKTRPCPCGLPETYQECCGRLHRGRARAATAEQLMRSRYSAFAVRDAAYLLASWHPATRPPALDFDRGLRWEGLEIVRTEDGTPFHDRGVVEFRARFTQNDHPGELHEVSRFTRHDGAWVYLNGTTD
ncbi:YchJ family protein [Actinomadura hibisca]|uniref:YchJ family protein n=1 Tax=Actinomadura hibisca TaxID=68565 RepID=UPI00083790CA|nr:YchJ family metal-binding protein [Actinomadura hibisca]